MSCRILTGAGIVTGQTGSGFVFSLCIMYCEYLLYATCIVSIYSMHHVF